MKFLVLVSILGLSYSCGSKKENRLAIRDIRVGSTPVTYQSHVELYGCDSGSHTYASSENAINSILYNVRLDYRPPYVANAGQEVVFCNNKQTQYASNTVEYIALKTIPTVERAHRTARDVMNISMDPIDLFIAPEIKQPTAIMKTGDRVEGVQYRYSLDNAAFMDVTKEKDANWPYPIISYYPESVELKQIIAELYKVNAELSLKQTVDVQFEPIPLGGKALWEYPFVSYHEYGHYIFNKILFEHFNVISLAMGEKLDLSQHHVTESVEELDNFNRFIRIFEESFADIFAFYTARPAEKDLTGNYCFEDDRELNKPNFNQYNRTAIQKILSKELLDNFLANEKIEMTEGSRYCNFDPSDYYALSSIFAHYVYKTYESYSITDREALQHMVDFATSLKSSRFVNLVHNQDYTGAIKVAVNTFKSSLNLRLATWNKNNDLSLINQNYCAIVKNILPVIYSDSCLNSVNGTI